MTSLPEKPPSQQTESAPAEEYISLNPEDNSNATETVKADASDPSQDSPNPPLPLEEPPPLPNEPLPDKPSDDGWEAVWDQTAQAFYFFNRITQATQWENPRVPDTAVAATATAVDNGPPGVEEPSIPRRPAAGGYDPAIHGDYDPNADYAKAYQTGAGDGAGETSGATDPSQLYAATGAFNRFTGKWQKADINPDNFNDENKSKRQMNAYFDVDAAANSHDGRSLKAERSGQKLSKKELKAFREKRREKKEEKRRAWLLD